jgi:hypothetical protein
MATYAKYVTPTAPDVKGLYTSALNRWLQQQKQSAGIFKTAESPLLEAKNLFAPGGGYGAGQTALIEDEARRAQAEALANQVATGMSSGSLATSTGLRVKSDMTKAKLGVEDTRTQFLADILSKLSGLRGAYAGQVSAAQGPEYGPVAGALANIYGSQIGGESNFWNAVSGNMGRSTPAKKITEEPWESATFS